MPTVGQIENSLFALAPREYAMDWDNVGLLVGDPSTEVSRVLVALDVTEQVVEEASAWKAQLIVAHHPVMNNRWLPVQSLREDTPQGRLLRHLIRSNLSAICMHTNLDVVPGGVNDVLLNALKLVDPGPLCEDGLGRTGMLQGDPKPLQLFVADVSTALHCNGIRYADGGKPVKRVAVGGGACGEFVDCAVRRGCDTLVTSDLGYHIFMDAAPKGINLIDAGHFPTEDPVCGVLLRYLKKQYPELHVMKSTSHREVIQYGTGGEL
jgi:dinuclear metal center YbgI/SA1388 family protein